MKSHFSVKRTGMLMLFVLMVLVSGCGNGIDRETVNEDEIEWKFCRSIAREMKEDGWCFSFTYERMKDGEEEIPGHVHYSFYGVNLRYAYSSDYLITEYREAGSKKYIEKYSPGILMWGYGSTNQEQDLKLLENEILLQNLSVEEMLNRDYSQYEFKELDGSMFFRLMREALQGETIKETRSLLAADKPIYAMLAEPEYIDGYKFQVAFVLGMGFIDELFIDIRYQTGESYIDYQQLSDIVERNEANQEQITVLNKLKEISNYVQDTDSFLTEAENYATIKIGEIDFARLYSFMDAIYKNEYSQYRESPQIISLEEIAN